MLSVEGKEKGTIWERWTGEGEGLWICHKLRVWEDMLILFDLDDDGGRKSDGKSVLKEMKK